MMTPTKRAVALLKLYGGVGGYKRVAEITGLHPGYIGRLANERNYTTAPWPRFYPSKGVGQRTLERLRAGCLNDWATWA